MEFNLADLFEGIADAIPAREAAVCGARRLSYADLDERANRLAHHLARAGIGRGDHVGLYLYNGTEFLEGMLAAFKLRAVPININYRYVADELRYLISNAELRALIADAAFGDRVETALAGLPPQRMPARLTVGAEYETALAAAPPGRGFDARSGDDLYIVYTGGTTGLPRGVMWRQEDIFFSGLGGGRPFGEPVATPAELVALAASGERAATLLPAAPFIHGAAQWAALIGLYAGGKLVIAPDPGFDAARVCRLIADEQVQTLTLVGDAMAGPLVDELESGARGLDLSSLMVIASGGAILSPSVRERLQAALPRVMIFNGFGASETGHQGTASPDESRRRFFMDDSSTVLDENLRPVVPGSGVVGRLARRGRVPLGYWRDPEKTAATFLTVDGQRWVVPGDLATVDADGTIEVLGRGAVCITTGGEKVFPEEVEEILKAHAAVLDAVVVGVPDTRWGERVTALVRLRPGASPSVGGLEAHCRAHLAAFKVPREVHLVAEVQRHPSGKPDYRWAKAAALAAGAP
jgi:acyl-CoA synthetase (AMP-forming)/AMP-acid ligase II